MASVDFRRLGFQVPELSTGRPPYSADLLLSVWLYGYLNRIRSSRQLERACREHVSLLWLTGMNSPDHNTLWRFWRANREALRSVFRQVVLVAYDSGLVGLAVHAVDGTKIRACSSSRSGCHKKELEEMLKHLDVSIDEAISEIESSEASESGESRLPESLVDAASRRAEIKKSLAKLEQLDRKHYHPGEEDARMMLMGKGVDFGYNAQAVVDSESFLITAAEVVTDESDNELLVDMVEEVKQNLVEAAEETVADGGYNDCPTSYHLISCCFQTPFETISKRFCQFMALIGRTRLWRGSALHQLRSHQCPWPGRTHLRWCLIFKLLEVLPE